MEPHPLHTELGADVDARQAAYRKLFQHHMDNDALHEIRQTKNYVLVLGRFCFTDRIEGLTKSQIRICQPGRPKLRMKRFQFGCLLVY